MAAWDDDEDDLDEDVGSTDLDTDFSSQARMPSHRVLRARDLPDFSKYGERPAAPKDAPKPKNDLPDFSKYAEPEKPAESAKDKKARESLTPESVADALLRRMKGQTPLPPTDPRARLPNNAPGMLGDPNAPPLPEPDLGGLDAWLAGPPGPMPQPNFWRQGFPQPPPVSPEFGGPPPVPQAPPAPPPPMSPEFGGPPGMPPPGQASFFTQGFPQKPPPPPMSPEFGGPPPPPPMSPEFGGPPPPPAWRQALDAAADPQWWLEGPKGIPRGAVSGGGVALQGAAALDPAQALATNVEDFKKDLLRVPTMTPEEIRALRRRADAAPPATRATVHAAISDLLEKNATKPKHIAEQFPGPTPMAERPLYKGGEAVKEFSKKILPPAPGYETAISTQLGEGLGTMLTGIPASLIHPALGGAMFVSMGVGEAAENAINFDKKERKEGRPGLTQDQIRLASLLGVAPGATDIIPVETLLGRLKVIPQPFVKPLAQAIARIGGQAFIEGFQEGGQKFLQNLIAREVYNPKQELTEDIVPEAAVGGGVGGIAQTGQEVLKGLLGRRGRGRGGFEPDLKKLADDIATPPVEPPPPGAPPGAPPIEPPPGVPPGTAPPGAPPAAEPPAAPAAPPGTTPQLTEDHLINGPDQPGGVDARDRRILRKKGYDDEMIDVMSPAERLAEIGEAAEQGITDDEAPAAPLPPEAAPEDKTVRGFTTARGSTYDFHDDGTTTRNKAARDDPGHEGDHGPKPRSEQTFFVDPTDANALAVPQDTKFRVIDHEDGTVSLATQNEDGKWGIAPTARNVPVQTEPGVGLLPVELWKSHKTYGKPGYEAVHFGNPITALHDTKPIPTSPPADTYAAEHPRTPVVVDNRGELPDPVDQALWALVQARGNPEQMLLLRQNMSWNARGSLARSKYVQGAKLNLTDAGKSRVRKIQKAMDAHRAAIEAAGGPEGAIEAVQQALEQPPAAPAKPDKRALFKQALDDQYGEKPAEAPAAEPETKPKHTVAPPPAINEEDGLLDDPADEALLLLAGHGEYAGTKRAEAVRRIQSGEGLAERMVRLGYVVFTPMTKDRVVLTEVGEQRLQQVIALREEAEDRAEAGEESPEITDEDKEDLGAALTSILGRPEDMAPITALANQKRQGLPPASADELFEEGKLTGDKNFPAPDDTTRSAKAVTETLTPEEAAARLQSWKNHANRIGQEEDHSGEVILSLFDRTGIWSQPYRDAGYTVVQYDILNGQDLMRFMPMADLMDIKEAGLTVVGVLAGPPCTSYAGSGARWWVDQHDKANVEMVEKKYGGWASKYFETPVDYANTLVAVTQLIVELSAPTKFHVLENPVGRIQRLNDLPKPTLIFNPNDYGDPYTKKTLLWGDFNPDLPQAHVEATEGSKIAESLRGTNPEEKLERSETPEGFAYAFFMANNTSKLAFQEQAAEEQGLEEVEEGDERLTTGEVEAINHVLDKPQTMSTSREALQTILDRGRTSSDQEVALLERALAIHHEDTTGEKATEPEPEPEPQDQDIIEGLRDYAKGVVGDEIRSVTLVGSAVAGGGQDIDLLYDLGEHEDFPEDEHEAEEAIENILERVRGLDLDSYDSFIRVNGRYFHLASGGGRAVIENTTYARDQRNKPTIELARDPREPGFDFEKPPGRTKEVPAKAPETEETPKAPETGPSDYYELPHTGEGPDTVASLKKKLVRFASGMSRIGDLKAGAHAIGGFARSGVGVDVGELTKPAIQMLARAVVDWKARIFIDSGAFSLFRRNIRGLSKVTEELGDQGKDVKRLEPLDFDEIMTSYSRVGIAIDTHNEAEEHVPPPLIVMPDIVGDQAASLELVEKYKDDIQAEAKHDGMRPIVPIQKGELTLAQAYARIVKILGTDRFIVGIPSNEKAVSNEELLEFLKEAKPTRIHFLGAVADKNLEPKLQAIADAGLTLEHLSGDGNILRGSMYGKVMEGTRAENIQKTVTEKAGGEDAWQSKFIVIRDAFRNTWNVARLGGTTKKPSQNIENYDHFKTREEAEGKAREIYELERKEPWREDYSVSRGRDTPWFVYLKPSASQRRGGKYGAQTIEGLDNFKSSEEAEAAAKALYEQEQAKPEAKPDKRALFKKALDDQYGGEPAPTPTPPAGPTPTPGKAAGTAAKGAAKATGMGLVDVAKGLDALFNPKNKLSMGVSFDKDSYEKAKPFFISGVRHFAKAGADIATMLRELVRYLADVAGFNRETQEEMEPYILQFLDDVEAGIIDITAPESPDEQAPVPPADQKPLDNLPPEEGGGAQGGRRPGGGDAGGGGAGTGPGGAAPQGGVPGGGGRRGGQGGVRVPAAGAGSGGGRGTGGRAGGAGGGVSTKSPGRKGRGRRGSADPVADVPPEAAPNLPAINFRITEDVELGVGTEGEKFRDNIDAIHVIKALESENRRATAEEQITLARYVGWGGLANAFADPSGNFKEGWEKRGAELAELLTPEELRNARSSTRNAHYTSETVVRAMWKGAQRLGFKGGLTLELSAGTGNFLGMVPEAIAGQTRFIAVEADSITARIAKALYPRETVLHSTLEALPFPEGEAILNIGNPPFGAESLRFQYKPELTGHSIHNQFFLAGLDALRPGGLQILVVSRFLMDAKDGAAREEIAKRAELVGAIRLPDTAFVENARTQVVTDILFLQKRTPEEQARAAVDIDLGKEHDRVVAGTSSALGTKPMKRELEWIKTTEISDPKGGEAITVNHYFTRNGHMILGSLERSGSMRVQNDVTVALPKGTDLAPLLNTAIERLPERTMEIWQSTIDQSLERHRTMAESLEIALSGEEPGHIAFNDNGRLTQTFERETPTGGHELTRRAVTPAMPWSRQLMLGADGKWFTLQTTIDPATGKPAKVEGSTRNVYVRKTFATEADIPGVLRLGQKHDRLVDLVRLRDLVKRQLVMEANDAPARDMERNRTQLKAAYDAFVAENGLVNLPSNASLISDMPDGALVQALEINYRPGMSAARAARRNEQPQPPSATPAPIMSRRVVPKYEPVQSADSPQDALSITLSEQGRVNMERIAELLDVPIEQAIEQLQAGEKPLIYFDPETQTWETRDVYLTGLVAQKLNAARQANLDLNAKALEAVQPEKWSAENIQVIVGSTWVPTADYEAFAVHLLGGGQAKATVRHAPGTNAFSFNHDGGKPQPWSTDDMPFVSILNGMLNSRVPKVVHEDSDGRKWVDQEATALVLLKAREIENEFVDWIFKDVDRRKRLVEIFNEKFNTRVERQHDGSHLQLPGKVPDEIIKLRRHQLNAIWRGIHERFMLLDHVVGAGKTFTAIARIMERRRMGLSRKPMIVVPNHLVGEWTAATYRLYPGAKVLALGSNQMDRKNRRRAFARIATGDWDMVIIPHSSFGFISISPATEQRFLDNELRLAQQAVRDAEAQAIEDGTAGGRYKPFNVKEAERLVTRINGRLVSLRGRKKDNLLTFEQMGVDDLTVDEAHEFKNLFYSSRLTGVRGMGDKSGSQKAFDLYNKVHVLRDSPTGTVTFLTGTPISNSAVEMYTVLRYLAADELKNLGLEHFDAWRAQSVTAEPAFEATEAGGLKEVTRLGSSWSNMRSLMALYYSVTDAVPQSDISKWYEEDNNGEPFPIPRVKGGDRKEVVIQPSEAAIVILNDVVAGFNSLPGISDQMERNSERLRLMDRARKLSLDVRAVDPRNTSPEKGGKLDRSAEEIVRIYRQWDADKGTQLVFLDRSVKASKTDKAQIKAYDAAVKRRDDALARGDDDAYRRAVDELDEFDPNEIEELRNAQNGGWNAYDQLKANLVARGIPANEIRFIQEANNDAEKKAIFDDVNDGTIRVLIGSTPKMGAGTNVQERIVALHHLDVTWKPSDIEQREGRGIRQGNSLLAKYGHDKFELEIFAYVTERTVDAKMWGLNSQKLRTINGIRKYDGAFTMEFEDEASVGMAEIAALASGDPLMLERVKLTSQIDRLELQERAHRRKIYGIEDAIQRHERTQKNAPGEIESGLARAALFKEALAGVKERAAARTVTIEGTTYTSPMEAAAALEAAIAAQKVGEEATEGDETAKPGPAKWSVTIEGQRYSNKVGAEEAIHDAFGDTVPFEATVGDKVLTRRARFAKQMSDAIAEEVEKHETRVGGLLVKDAQQAEWNATLPVGSMFGLNLEMELLWSKSGKRIELHLVDKDGKTLAFDYRYYGPAQAIGTPQTRPVIDDLMNVLNSRSLFTGNALRENIAEAETELPRLREELTKPFAQQSDLQAKRGRLEAVVTELAERTRAAEAAGGAPAPAPAPARGPARQQVEPARQRLTKQAVAQRNAIVEELRNAIAQVAGFATAKRAQFPDAIDAEVSPDWGEAGRGQEVSGIYHPLLDLIKVALATSDDALRTAYHEAWHAIEGVITPEELAILRRETERLRAYVVRNSKRSREQFATVEPEEVWAEAAAIYTRAQRNEQSGGGIHIAVRQIFNKLIALWQRVRNAMAGLGFERAEDIFEKFAQGEMAERRVGTQRFGKDNRWWDQRTDEFLGWFGESKVVDENGQPKVVYHGTTARFDAFDPAKLGSNTATVSAEGGFFFSDRRKTAASFAGLNTRSGRAWARSADKAAAFDRRHAADLRSRGKEAEARAFEAHRPQGPNVLPVFLSLQDPLIHDFKGKEVRHTSYAEIIAEAKAEGHDGVILKNTYDSVDSWRAGSETIYVVFEPNQIKSANENTGAYDPDNPNIRQQLGPGRQRISLRSRPGTGLQPGPENFAEGWATAGSYRERLRAAIDASLLAPTRVAADRQLDLARFTNAARLIGTRITESIDIALSASLYAGKVGERMVDVQQELFEPLYKEMKKQGLATKQGRQDLDDYLYARGAYARNEMIRDIDSANDAGSGMTDAEADAIMIRLQPNIAKFEAVARHVDRIVRHNRAIMVREGLETQDTIDEWEAKQPYYVPYKGFEGVEEDDDPGSPSSGSGFDVRGPESRQALGRDNRADNILVNLLDQTQRVIIRAEKNRVAKTFLRFVRGHPSPYWKLGLATTKRRPNPATGLVEYYTVIESAQKDKVFAAKVGGKTYHIVIQHNGLLHALKNLGAEKMTKTAMFIHRITREYSRLLTGKDPEFVLSNLLRDLQDAAFTITGEQRAQLLKNYAKNIASGKALYGAILGTTDTGASRQARQWFEEWRSAGGKISHYGLKDFEIIRKEMQGNLDQLVESRGMKAAMLLPRAINPINGSVVKFLEAVSDVTESTTRLAVYMAARQSGLSQSQAAHLARNATVDFNKRGTQVWLSSLYAFANANIQGNLRLMRTLRKSKVARRVAMGLVVAGMLMTFWNMAFSPEDEEKKKAYEKRFYNERERNMFFYYPGMTKDSIPIKIPLGFGLNVFWMIGEQIAMRSLGKVGTFEAIGNILGTTAQAFNPLGSMGSWLDIGTYGRMIAPSVIRFIPDYMMNRNVFDRPIHPDRMPWNVGTPRSEQHKMLTSQNFIEMSKAISRWTGGNSFEPGALDMYPDDIEHAWNFAIGGLGRFLTNTHEAVRNYSEGVDTPVERMPFVRRFAVSDNSLAATSEDYYKRRTEAMEMMRRVRNAVTAQKESPVRLPEAEDVEKRLGDKVGMRRGPQGGVQFRREAVFRKSDKDLKGLREEEQRIRLSDMSRAEKAPKIKLLREQMREIQAGTREPLRITVNPASP